MDSHENSLSSESDVEQKVVWDLLVNILQIPREAILTKRHVSIANIGKSKGRRRSYYPDYLIQIDGIPVLVVEAKSTERPLEEATHDALLYADEINRAFPGRTRPIEHCIGCNGNELLVTRIDTARESISGSVQAISPGTHEYERLLEWCGYTALDRHATTIRSALALQRRYKPLTLVGGPSRQNEEVEQNAFAAELVPLIYRYFSSQEARHDIEILRYAYVSTDEIDKHTTTLQSLLKDRAPRQKNVNSVETHKSGAPSVDETLAGAMATKEGSHHPFVLLLGGVGAGKSTFIERYFRILMAGDIQDATHQAVVDFNKAPESLIDIETWICEQFVRDMQRRSADPEQFFSSENLKRYFAPKIREREIGVYRDLKETNHTEYIKALTGDLASWYDNPVELAKGVARYCYGDRGEAVIVVFDDVDRRGREDQLRIFQAVQWFRQEIGGVCILALRDETYDAFKSKPPLDAFATPFALRIQAPNFLQVVRKRLHLALEELSNSVGGTRRYQVESGVTVTYPASKAGEYLAALYEAVCSGDRYVRLLMEALAGRNVRSMLDMFSSILTSGHVRADQLFAAKTTRQGRHSGRRSLPEYIVLRALMRTGYRFYSDEHGYIKNIFYSPDQESISLFVGPALLGHLGENRKSKEHEIEGYLLFNDVQKVLQASGFEAENIRGVAERFLEEGLIQADHQRLKGLADEDYVKITAAGWYHLKFLTERLEYAGNVVWDVALGSKELAQKVTRSPNDNVKHQCARARALIEGLRYEWDIGDKSGFGTSLGDDVVRPTISRLEAGIAFAEGRAPGGGVRRSK